MDLHRFIFQTTGIFLYAERSTEAIASEAVIESDCCFLVAILFTKKFPFPWVVCKTGTATPSTIPITPRNTKNNGQLSDRSRID